MTNQPTASGVSEEMVEAMRHEQARCVLDGLGWESEKAAKRVLEAALSAKPAQVGGLDNREALQSAAKFLEERLGNAPCDSAASSCCVRCASLYLARTMKDLLAAAPPQPIPTPDEAWLIEILAQILERRERPKSAKILRDGGEISGVTQGDCIAAMRAALSRARPEEAPENGTA